MIMKGNDPRILRKRPLRFEVDVSGKPDDFELITCNSSFFNGHTTRTDRTFSSFLSIDKQIKTRLNHRKKFHFIGFDSLLEFCCKGKDWFFLKQRWASQVRSQFT